MTELFAVDGNFYLHRCWHTLKTNRPVEEALPYALTGLITKDACAVKASRILVAFDGARVFRYDLYKHYKANRGKEPGAKSQGKEIYSYLPAVLRYLESAGLAYVHPPKYEADDVLASVATQIDNSVLGARDKDLYQSLRRGVRCYDSTGDHPSYISYRDAEKIKGVSVSQMVDYQTLLGDATDNIPQFKPPGKARSILQEHGSINAWFGVANPEDRRWLRANQVGLALNKKLVTLKTDLELPALSALKVPRLELQNMPKAWYAYQAFIYPKSRGLF